ncbi:hypothetical protein D9M68_621690 [compost metagenome]
MGCGVAPIQLCGQVLAYRRIQNPSASTNLDDLGLLIVLEVRHLRDVRQPWVSQLLLRIERHYLRSKDSVAYMRVGEVPRHYNRRTECALLETAQSLVQERLLCRVRDPWNEVIQELCRADGRGPYRQHPLRCGTDVSRQPKAIP